MIISGQFLTLITFPGVIMHEIAHRFMCDLLQIPVYDIKYFSIGNPQAGHVDHHKTDNIIHDFLIGFTPMLLNTLFCMLFTLPYSSTINITRDGIHNYPSMFLWWIGISIGIHAFPSNQDLRHAWTLAQEEDNFLLIRFLCSMVNILNKLSFIGSHLAYAAVVSIILPLLLFGTPFE